MVFIVFARTAFSFLPSHSLRRLISNTKINSDLNPNWIKPRTSGSSLDQNRAPPRKSREPRPDRPDRGSRDNNNADSSSRSFDRPPRSSNSDSGPRSFDRNRSGGGSGSAGYTGNRDMRSRGDYNREDTRSSFARDETRPTYYKERDENYEPAYGYYNGDHIYGITPVKLALTSKRRQISELLIQTGMDTATKKDSKSASDILSLCEENNIRIREFSKHDLNMLTDSRPHQGFVLRASPLEFSELTCLEPSKDFK